MPLNNFGTCGPLGRSAQPDEHGFATARFLGYNHILKLNSDDEFSLEIETRCFEGGDIWCAPMNSFKPDEHQVRGLIDEIRFIQPPSRLLIHCTHGRDRTGFVCAAYRILVENWTAEAAWTEMQQYGWTPISSLTDHAIHEMLERLTKK